MKTARIALAAVLVAGLAGTDALADGMIVPVRPDLRVRGSWAVKYHHVDITVRDQVANVTIDQQFVNTGRGMIEVEYLFPVPPDAAVDSMTLVVNGKEYAAKLLDADEARRIYESIVRKKKDPALLEYAGFGLYRTRAFPLEPGKPCKVLVTYKNTCPRDRDLVEVWYPLNTEKFSAKPIDSVRVRVDIASDADITAVYSPTHDLKTDRKGPRRVIATYEAKQTLPATDFQVYYKAADEAVGATLLTWQPDRKTDGYFLMLASPNPRAGRNKVVAKDVVIVLDHSGSMSGDDKLRQAKEALRYVVGNLNAKDRFNIVCYNDQVEALFDRLRPAWGPALDDALDRIDRIDATGGTNIHEALKVAMAQCTDKKRPGYVLFLTDGKPTVGKTKEADILADTASANDAKVRLFAFGVGYQPNVRLLDKLASQNAGRSEYVKPAEPIETKVSSLYAKIKNPVMTGLSVKLDGLRTRNRYPRDVGDLFDGDQLLLVGRYDAGDARKLAGGDKKRSTLVIKGRFEGKERAFEYPVTVLPPGRKNYRFVEKLWAIRRVGYLLDEIQLHGKSKEIVDELVRLSRDYGIMTPYTSFLADETTELADRTNVRRTAEREALALARKVDGAAGQMGADVRGRLKAAARPAPAAQPGGGRSGAVVYGNTRQDLYEKGAAETVRTVRNVGDQAVYQRGKLWVAANAADVHPEKDAEKIQAVERFSKEYFELVRANTVAQNQVLASQQADEELMIRLRGQVYRIR